MFRFSRDKRFFGNIKYSEFTTIAQTLVALLKKTRPRLSVDIFSSENQKAYEFTQITFVTDGILEALEKRPCYNLKQFTKEVWERSLSLDLILRDPRDIQPFMISVSLDRMRDGASLKFYGQAMDEPAADKVKHLFGTADYWFSIGDGYPKGSDVNLAFGLNLLRAKAL